MKKERDIFGQRKVDVTTDYRSCVYQAKNGLTLKWAMKDENDQNIRQSQFKAFPTQL